jgi:2-phosphoglycerate kinase
MDTSILIGGVSRSGKSTLVSRIRQLKPHLTYICGDALVTTFENVFPSFGIKHIDEHSRICACFDPFLFDYLENLEYERATPFILDTYHMLPEQVARRELQKKYGVIFLGYPTYDPARKLKEIRTYDPATSWTNDVTDEELADCIEGYLSVSRIMQQQCKQYGIPFIDMGAVAFDEGIKKALTVLGV